MTDCIFCKIINHEIPNYTVYEDENVLAYLDISQVTKGHTLVIPKKHVADIFEYDEALASAVFSKIPMIARAVKKHDPAIQGMNILNNNGAFAHQSVFHSHVHLIPRYEDTSIDGFGLKWETHDKDYTQETFKSVAEAIQAELEEA